jgi:hypothetical protein
MVYCMKCGTENADDAVNCSKCGAQLNAAPSSEYRRYRRYDTPYFRRGNIWGIAIGLFFILWGALSLLGFDIWDKVWPLFIMLIGLIIVLNTFMRQRG